jgi:hypothetical protein
MAQLQDPQPGQPLDLDYVSTVVKAVNGILDKLASSNSVGNSTVATAAGNEAAKTSDLVFVGGYKEIFGTAQSVTAGTSKDFSLDFPNGIIFKVPPIVTATPYTLNSTDAGRNVTVILKSVTTSKVEGTVIFNANGNVSIGVNLIAIGVPRA